VPVTLSAGEERTITFNIGLSKATTYNYFMLSTYDRQSWFNGSAPENNTITKTLSFTVKPGVTVTQSVLSDNTTPHVGQTATLSFKVKNWGSSSIDLGKIGLGGRDPQNYNVDPGVVPVTLGAGEEKIISFKAMLSRVGVYKYFVISTANNGQSWSDGPISEDISVDKALNLTVSN
jgi:hypothetical protein